MKFRILIIIIIFFVFPSCIMRGSIQTKNNVNIAFKYYLNQVSKKNLERTKSPCSRAVGIFLKKHTKWKIVYKKCKNNLCVIRVIFKEPQIDVWLRKIMKESTIEAIRTGGMKDLEKRTCEIIAAKIKKGGVKKILYKNIVKCYELKRVSKRWSVKEVSCLTLTKTNLKRRD